MSEFRSQRRIAATPEAIFHCIEDPALLARWWGPAGFSCTFESFDFRQGGLWKFVMHGPDGTDYPNENRFVEIAKPHRFVVRHVVAPLFAATITLEGVAGGSWLTWVQAFDDPEVAKAVASVVEPANEQLLDKLQTLAEGRW